MNIKQVTTSLCLATGLMTLNTVFAQDYQWEAGFGNASVETDVSSAEIDTTLIHLSHYFKPVSTANGPLAEAAFLSRVNMVGLTWAIDMEYSEPGFFTLDGDGFLLDGLYYIPGTSYFVAIEIDRLEFDFPLPSELDNTVFTAGMYLDARSRLSFSLASGSEFGDDTSAMSLEYKNLLKTAGKNISLEAGIASEEIELGFTDLTNTVLSLSANYYLNNALSIGAGFSSNSGDDKESEGTTLSFEVVFFVAPTLAFELYLEEFSVDDEFAGEDSSTVAFAITGRF